LDKTTVMVNNKAFEWTPENGLDKAAALELEAWIIKLARPFLRKARLLHIEFDDLIQDGLLAAMNACKTFEPEKSNFLYWSKFRILDALCEAVKYKVMDSLDDTSDNDETKTAVEPVDETVVIAFDDCVKQILVTRLLNKIPKLNRVLIKARFGIGHKREYSITELVKRFKMSRSIIINHINTGIFNMKIETLQINPGGSYDRKAS